MSSFKAIRSASGRRRAEDEPSVKFDDDIEDLPPLLRSLRLGHHDRVFNNEFQEDLGKHIDRLPPSPLANARHKARTSRASPASPVLDFAGQDSFASFAWCVRNSEGRVFQASGSIRRC